MAHHVDFLLLLHMGLADLSGAFDGATLALRLLEVVCVVFGEDIPKVDTLVDEGRLDQLKREINLVDFPVLVSAEKFAHEEDQVEELAL